jgi:hypothetical protein
MDLRGGGGKRICRNSVSSLVEKADKALKEDNGIPHCVWHFSSSPPPGSPLSIDSDESENPNVLLSIPLFELDKLIERLTSLNAQLGKKTTKEQFDQQSRKLIGAKIGYALESLFKDAKQDGKLDGDMKVFVTGEFDAVLNLKLTVELTKDQKDYIREHLDDTRKSIADELDIGKKYVKIERINSIIIRLPLDFLPSLIKVLKTGRPIEIKAGDGDDDVVHSSGIFELMSLEHR